MEKQLELQNIGWLPAYGSWEEAVVSWHEQVETAFRRKLPKFPSRSTTTDKAAASNELVALAGSGRDERQDRAA